ncbi:hypothetical protein [Pseudonocardia sp. T1-2H]|uniref:hypothetical protein n=1 Tax=Pseudonocardia sp. T1-2H TaxID=3128899 RepID=UPI0031016D79
MALIHDARSIVSTFAALDIPVPDEIRTAVERSSFRVTHPTTYEAEEALAAAKDQRAFDKAVLELAHAAVIKQMLPEVLAGHVGSARERALRTAVSPHLDGLFAAVCDKYNAAVPAFVSVVERIPDLSGMGLLDISPDVSAALLEAKQTVVPLAKAWAAYTALMKAEGHEVGVQKQAGPAALTVARLGSFEDQAQALRAVELHRAYARGDSGLFLGGLAPHVGIIRVGGTLNLVSPADAFARSIDVD